MNQIDIELKYSRKHRQAVMLDFINHKSTQLQLMCNNIQNYLDKEYNYDSKNRRIQHVKDSLIPLDQIALEILCIVLPMKEINPVQSVCTRLAHLFNFDTITDGIKTAAEILAVTEGYYFELYSWDWWENRTGTMGIRSNIQLPEYVTKELEATMYLPPMICQPKPWTKNTGGGYKTVKESVILGSMNHHNKKMPLDVINYLQSIPLELNEYVLTQKESLGKNLDPKAQLQFDNHVAQANDVYELYRNKPFYLVWKACKRHRLYDQGHHIHLQGYKYKRALINFHHKEKVCS